MHMSKRYLNCRLPLVVNDVRVYDKRKKICLSLGPFSDLMDGNLPLATRHEVFLYISVRSLLWICNNVSDRNHVITLQQKHFYTKDRVIINYCKLSLNCITGKKTLCINTIIHA